MPRAKYYERKTRLRPKMIAVPEHQWAKLVQECQRAGYSKTSIEAATGLSRERIDSLLFKGTEPLWKHGEALLKFVYMLRAGKEKENEGKQTTCDLS